MNLHLPQSIAAATELRVLASVLQNIISPRTCGPLIQLFQDTMTGAHRISKDHVKVPEQIVMNILARIKLPFIRKNRPWTGAEIISAALPIMNYSSKNLTIENGMLTRGVLAKGGQNMTGLIHLVYNDFTPERCGQLINDVQSIVTQYNLYTGFSVGAADLMADQKTLDFVEAKIKSSKEEVSRLISNVHSGAYVSVPGQTAGMNLDDNITKTLNDVSISVSKQMEDNIDPANRIVEMVNSGAKGSFSNITQMSALLGQQQIEGQRVKYTLQDRTLPHFPRFDRGMESRGFVEHSFIQGLIPTEFFFHAQAGREGLIDTAVKTSETGYIQRRLVKFMEDQHVEHDGTVRNVLKSIVQFKYGEDGIETTKLEEVDYDLATMSLESIYTRFALNVSQVQPFLSETITECNDMVEEIIKDREMLIKNVFRYKRADKVYSPVNVKRIVEKYSNKFTTRTNLTPEGVMIGLKKFANEFPENKLFHALLRYYLAPKQSIVVHRLTQPLFNELMADIRFKYIKAHVCAGEMVGVLAAQSIGEPTTQLTLNTFHSAGTAKANATSGVPRIEELLQASPNPKKPSNTLYLTPEFAFDSNKAISKLKEIQKTTLRDITNSVRIYYDPFPFRGSSVKEDAEILELYEQFSTSQDGKTVSPWVMRIELNDNEKVARNVLDLTRVQAEIHKTIGTKMVECMHSDTSAEKIILRILFDSGSIKTPIQLRFLESKILDTVLTGVDGIGKVHHRKEKNEMTFDPVIGGYVSKEQYLLDVEGTNLYSLLNWPGVDGTKTTSNDIHEIAAVFGIEAARLAIFEEINEVFSAEKVNYHHLSVLVDSMTFCGRIVAVSRNGMNKNEAGVLARSSFEETTKHMFNAAISGEIDDMKGVSANIMFGQKPPCGTGFVDILVDESLLPEGHDDGDVDPYSDAMARVDEKLSVTRNTECRIEDIQMDW
jgi:DNA-directed RNA polymerase II subunit RPB1